MSPFSCGAYRTLLRVKSIWGNDSFCVRVSPVLVPGLINVYEQGSREIVGQGFKCVVILVNFGGMAFQTTCVP
jgi:hypothetical protein